MGKALLITIGVLLIYSFVRFRIRFSIDKKMVVFLLSKCRLTLNEVRPLLSLASAYTNIGLYATAYEVYTTILSSPNLSVQLSPNTIEKIKINQDFCQRPLPWSTGAKDLHYFRFIHNFFLQRFGRSRYVFITEDDALEFNAFMRARKYKS